MILLSTIYHYRNGIQHFRVKWGLLGSEAGKGQLLDLVDLGRMFANDAKTVQDRNLGETARAPFLITIEGIKSLMLMKSQT